MQGATEHGALGAKLVRVPRGVQVVVTSVRLIDGLARQPIEGASVVVDGDLITQVLPPGSPVPAGAEVIDGTGKTLIPGLIDAHAHLDGLETKDPYRRFFTPLDGVKTLRAARDASRYLEAGWTTLADLGVGKGLDLRAAIESGLILGPRILTVVAPLSYTGGHVDWPIFPYEWVKERGWRGRICDGVDECRKAVRLNFREGADLIKVMVTGGLGSSTRKWSPGGAFTAEELQAIVDETTSHGGLVAAHCMGGGPGVRKAALAGVQSIEHGLVEKQDYDVLSMLAEREIVLVPTLSAWHCIAKEGHRKGYGQTSIDSAARFAEITAEMVLRAKAEGVRLAAGSDAHYPLDSGPCALELELLVDAGLTEMEALIAATHTAAQSRGLADEVGSISPGKRADMLLLDVNPLANIASLNEKHNILKIFSTAVPNL